MAATPLKDAKREPDRNSWRGRRLAHGRGMAIKSSKAPLERAAGPADSVGADRELRSGDRIVFSYLGTPKPEQSQENLI
jgi:hypothetical protein